MESIVKYCQLLYIIVNGVNESYFFFPFFFLPPFPFWAVDFVFFPYFISSWSKKLLQADSLSFCLAVISDFKLSSTKLKS